jgi:flagellar export protein FliJ
MSQNKKIKTRLDPLVRIREHDEKMAREKLAQAIRERAASEAEVQDAGMKVDEENRGQGEVAQWIVSDVANLRARIDHVKAEEKLVQANDSLDDARSEHEAAFQRARVLQRVADGQRKRQKDLIDKRDRQALDEIALMRFRVAQAG